MRREIFRRVQDLIRANRARKRFLCQWTAMRMQRRVMVAHRATWVAARETRMKLRRFNQAVMNAQFKFRTRLCLGSMDRFLGRTDYASATGRLRLYQYRYVVAKIVLGHSCMGR